VAGRERTVRDFEQQVVLPEAERQGDAEDDQADDYPGAELVQMLDQREAVFMGDRLDPAGHLRASAAVLDDGIVGLARLVGLVGLSGLGGLAGRRRGLRGLDLGRRRGLVIVVVLAGERSFELADTSTDRLAELRKAFGPEDDQGDDQDDR
jgi:hypothetical protein